MKKIILCLFIAFTFSNASDDSKSGLELFLKNYDWGLFWEEFSVSSEIQLCTPKDPTKGTVGFRATMIEPLYIADVTIKPDEIKTLGMSLGNGSADRNGNMSEDGGTYVNIFKFPVMEMVLKNTTRGLFYFEKGYSTILYIGQTDIKKWNDVMSLALNPEKQLLLTVTSALAGSASCVANTALSKLSGNTNRTSKTAVGLKTISDSMYYSMGCAGAVPTGTNSVHEDPIVNAKLSIGSILSDMFARRGMVTELKIKHRVRSVLNGRSKKVFCKGVLNPLIPMSQYTMQLIYPTTGESEEMGVSSVEYAFKGKGKSGKSVVFAINQRRDYAAFAYQD